MDEPAETRRISTGIDGLDAILGGGLIPERVYLVQGAPGTGKTTLAMQYLIRGATNGETVLYFALSESEEELRANARSHGFRLDGITFHAMSPAEEVRADSHYTLFHPAEAELVDATQRLVEVIDRVAPNRVVFDSLSAVRHMAAEPLWVQRQILHLRKALEHRRCTALLLDELLSSEDGNRELQSLVHGVVVLDSSAPEYGTTRRRLHVLKMRGTAFDTGYHDYTIQRGGLVVFPRLVASNRGAHPPAELSGTGLVALDALLGGGLHRGTSTLVMGPAGCGKSILGSQIVHAAAARGERAVMLTFDESVATLLARSDGLGIDLRGDLDRGLVEARQIDPAELTTGELAETVRRAVEHDHARVVVIDSLNGYLAAMPGEQFLLLHLHELLSYLGQKGIVTVIVVVQHGVLGEGVGSPVDVSYLADTILLLRYFEAGGEVRKAISVVKSGRGAHEQLIRELWFGSDGVHIGEPLAEFHGVLTGVPTYVGARSALMGGSNGERS